VFTVFALAAETKLLLPLLWAIAKKKLFFLSLLFLKKQIKKSRLNSPI